MYKVLAMCWEAMGKQEHTDYDRNVNVPTCWGRQIQACGTHVS